MPTLADKIDFAQTYIHNKEGKPWTLKGREWVRDEFWKAADGFKLWRPKGVEVCSDCKDSIGQIIEHPDDNPTRAPNHKHGTDVCGGLDAEPIIITILNLTRQDGKSFNSMAYAYATMGRGRSKSIGLMAASEDQVAMLLRENYEEALNNSPKLAKNFNTIGLRVENKKTHSFLEGVAASARSATGRTRTHLLIDEARDIPAEVAWAIIPAIQTQHGIECPRGHVQIGAEELARAPKKCSACGERLVPWFARLIIMSSSGVVKEEGGENFWLAELVEKIEQEPHPNVHLFRSETPLNPAKSAKIVSAITQVFGGLDSMRDYVEADMTNRWTRRGDAFVSKADLDRVIDSTLANENGGGAPCVAFLDTSVSAEKTQLVILADDTELSSEPWEHVYVSRLDVWKPEEQARGVIDDAEILRHLDMFIPMFPSLRVLCVDTRGMPWAIAMMRTIKTKKRPWSGIAQAWDKTTGLESDQGWGLLEQRIMQGRIRLPDNVDMRKEFRGVKRKPTTNRPTQVVDVNRKKSHKDITETLALCCYLAAMEQLQRRVGLASRVKTATNAAETLSRLRASGQTTMKGPVSKNFGPDSY